MVKICMINGIKRGCKRCPFLEKYSKEELPKYEEGDSSIFFRFFSLAAPRAGGQIPRISGKLSGKLIYILLGLRC